MPGVPRYIQKLVKEKSKTNKSYRAKLSSLSFQQGGVGGMGVGRKRTHTVNSILKEPTIERCSSYEFRTRGFTLGTAEDNVFVDELQNNNIDDLSSGKRKKIRFSPSSGVSEDKATAKYLQTLAHFGRWDEFSKTLKEAQNSGFSKNSLRFSSSSSKAKDEDGDDNGNRYQNIFRQFLDTFPKLKSVELDQDFFQIIILLATLELPYFIARVVFTIKYNVSSTTMVFYTTKNVVMVIFLIYRLWVKFSANETNKDIEGCEEDEDDYSRDVMNLK
jgi:Transmembrane protein 26.